METTVFVAVALLAVMPLVYAMGVQHERHRVAAARRSHSDHVHISLESKPITSWEPLRIPPLRVPFDYEGGIRVNQAGDTFMVGGPYKGIDIRHIRSVHADARAADLGVRR